MKEVKVVEPDEVFMPGEPDTMGWPDRTIQDAIVEAQQKEINERWNKKIDEMYRQLWPT